MKADLHDEIMRLPYAVPFPIVNDSKLAYMEGHRDARHAAAELALAASGGNAAPPGLTDEQIMAQYDAQIAKGGSADSVILRTCRAIEAASAPNAALVAALQDITALYGTEENEWDGVERVIPEMVKLAKDALSAAGQEVGK